MTDNEEPELSDEDVDSAYYWTNNGGYNFASDGDNIAGIHVLFAISEGADPFKTFGEGTEVHHVTGGPVKIDHPNNVRVVTCDEYHEIHGPDASLPDPEAIFLPDESAVAPNQERGAPPDADE